MHITNIGGSLTTAVCLSLIAWSIRVLRSAKLVDNAQQQTSTSSIPSIKSNRWATHKNSQETTTALLVFLITNEMTRCLFPPFEVGRYVR